MKLAAKDPLTQLVQAKGVHDWEILLDHVKHLPYGRNANRTDFSLVIKEQKGTCSSKHAFLKKMADLNNLEGVELILGMFKMSQQNTPGIGEALAENSLAYMPEAHCYLKINGERIDATNSTANFTAIKDAIIEEISIVPEQVGEFKVKHHQDFLKKWLLTADTPFNFEQIWKIREQCIANLAATS